MYMPRQQTRTPLLPHHSRRTCCPTALHTATPLCCYSTSQPPTRLAGSFTTAIPPHEAITSDRLAPPQPHAIRTFSRVHFLRPPRIIRHTPRASGRTLRAARFAPRASRPYLRRGAVLRAHLHLMRCADFRLGGLLARTSLSLFEILLGHDCSLGRVLHLKLRMLRILCGRRGGSGEGVGSGEGMGSGEGVGSGGGGDREREVVRGGERW